MKNFFENILKLFQLKPLIIFSLGLAASFLLFTFPKVIVFESFGDNLLRSPNFIIFICVIYYIALSGIIFTIFNILSNIINKISKLIISYSKVHKALHHINDSIEFRELYLLQKHLRKDQRIFIAGKYGEGAFLLSNKGLLKENQHITEDKYEYEIPYLVWISKKFRDFVNKREIPDKIRRAIENG